MSWVSFDSMRERIRTSVLWCEDCKLAASLQTPEHDSPCKMAAAYKASPDFSFFFSPCDRLRACFFSLSLPPSLFRLIVICSFGCTLMKSHVAGGTFTSRFNILMQVCVYFLFFLHGIRWQSLLSDAHLLNGRRAIASHLRHTYASQPRFFDLKRGTWPRTRIYKMIHKNPKVAVMQDAVTSAYATR